MAIVESGTAGAALAYQVIFVIVGFSVTVQGGLVPALAHRLRIPLRSIEPEPWSLGVRFSEEPEGLHRYHVARGSAADGSTVERPAVRRERLGQPGHQGRRAADASPATPPCSAGDDVLVLADPDETPALERCFTRPQPADKPQTPPEDC